MEANINLNNYETIGLKLIPTSNNSVTSKSYVHSENANQNQVIGTKVDFTFSDSQEMTGRSY